jgi:hypothetical protein
MPFVPDACPRGLIPPISSIFPAEFVFLGLSESATILAWRFDVL